MALIDLLNGSGTWIPWNNVSLPANTCAGGGAAAMSGGGLSGPSVRPSFSDRYVEFVETFVRSGRLNAVGFVAAARAMAEMSAAEMTAADRADLAARLDNARPYAHSDVAADLIPALVRILTK